MHWNEIITLFSCIAALIGAPVAFALYLGNKIDAISKEVHEIKAQMEKKGQ